MKTRSDQKRIITGGILAVVCILLCFGGVWGCIHTAKNGQGQTQIGGDAAEHSGVQDKESGAGITPDSVTKTMDGILLWQCAEYGVSDVQELIDKAYAGRALNGTVQTYVIGLYGYQPGYDYTCYLSSVQDALKEDLAGTMSLQKSSMVLSVLQAENPVSVELLEETIGEQGMMSYLYGLLMLNGMSAQDGVWTREALVQEILLRQLSDGGFAITGTEGDVDVTAMALQALAPYYKEARENENDARIVQTVEKALVFLSEKQLATGDFENRGTPNAESTAQVILALCALERDVWADEAFMKEGVTLLDGLSRYQNADGGFCHTEQTASNDMAASQVFAALSAVNRSMQGKCFLFDFAGYERDDTFHASPEEIITHVTYEQSGRVKDGGMDMRTALILLIFAAGCGYLAYLCFTKKYCRKRLGGTLLVIVVFAAAIWFIRIQTREEYLRQDNGRSGESRITVSMEIRCDTVAGAEDYLPQDGVILAKTSVSAYEGDSAFDVLRETARVYDIPVEYEGTAAGDAFAYIEGISYLYEYDYGELSGWIFLINGEAPDVGCGSYRVADGDEIVWYYSKELGRDVKWDS
ncbi:MAG: DUF4430 domain-containing protein [Lachnospiraceae bacterium]|nr:DUF4430 domain-containing protein [Lachnospiraceae bacterium]